MAKGILEFELPVEQVEFDMAQDGLRAINVLYSMDQHLRGLIKYTELPDEVNEMVMEIREKLFELIEEENVRHIFGD